MRQKQRGPIIDFVSRFLLSNPANPILLVLESRKHALDKKWLRVNKTISKIYDVIQLQTGSQRRFNASKTLNEFKVVKLKGQHDGISQTKPSCFLNFLFLTFRAHPNDVCKN